MEKNKYYFIHLEGMDLAGKSTIAKLIKAKNPLNWEINNNKLTEDNVIHSFTNELGKQNLYDDEIYGYLYFVALLADIKNFKQETNIIQDSTLLLRSINYHTEMGNDKLVKLFKELIEHHPIPDISIYLTASIESRVERITKKIKESPEKVSKNDALILENPQKFMEMDEKLARLSQECFNSYILDTSSLNEHEIVDYISNLCGLENSVHIKKKVNK